MLHRLILRYTLSIVTICSALSLHAENPHFYLKNNIQEITSIAEIKQWTDSADSSTLIIFDMDYTIVMPENPAFHRPNFMKYVNGIKELENTLSPDAKAVYPGVVMSSGPLCLIEQETAELISTFQEKALKTIILTGSPVGEIGEISSIENWRIEELQRLGIDVSSSFPDSRFIIFNSLAIERGYYPVFTNGLLSTNGDLNTKGETLTAFLQHLGWKPSRVIFIDDKVSYLNSMGPPLASLGIEYIGIHYRGSEHVPATDLSEEAIKGSWQAIIAKAKLIADQR